MNATKQGKIASFYKMCLKFGYSDIVHIEMKLLSEKQNKSMNLQKLLQTYVWRCTFFNFERKLNVSFNGQAYFQFDGRVITSSI